MRFPVRAVMVALATLVAMLPAQAEAQYKSIELKILGMDCAICAHGVRVAVQKVEGVESVQLSLERAVAEIRLKPNNRVTLDQFRRIVKGNGFEPREAKVVAAGAPRSEGDRLTFEIPGNSSPLGVSSERSAAAAYKILKSSAAASVEVAGTVERQPDGSDVLAVVTVK